MAKIPKALHEPINMAFPNNVCTLGTVLSNGYAQITPKGSILVYDDETLAYWDRGRGSTHDAVKDGTKLTVFFRDRELRASGVLPKGGIARFYGTARLFTSGPEYERVWETMQQAERDSDPEKKGLAVLIDIERAENLSGEPLP
ncbi:MAG: pyridoxamine 5'-phosphate oxidase family protein [bacterium]|nr:pyridoxamine 5'-phosphate oxidase family protein [bacterium]